MAHDSDDCPITEEFVGRLVECRKHGIDTLVSDLSQTQRGRLAVFCYRRAHLHDVGLAIAATCELEALIDASGKAGHFLFAQSRERPEPMGQLVPRRAKVTLATNASRLQLDAGVGAI
jgi:hypothetical protein